MAIASQHDAVQVALLHTDQLILVDERDTATGNHASKLFCHLRCNIDRGTALHRAFSLFVFDPVSHRLLLQQRAQTKVTFPHCWTNTCCSHPLASETEEQDAMGVRRAAVRKVNHELGVADMAVSDVHYITRIRYRAAWDADWGEDEVDYVLIAVRPVTVIANANEVSATRWVTPVECRALLDSGDAVTPWFRLIAERFLFGWWARLGELDAVADHAVIHAL